MAVGSPEGKEEEKNPVGGGLLWSVVVSSWERKKKKRGRRRFGFKRRKNSKGAGGLARKKIKIRRKIWGPAGLGQKNQNGEGAFGRFKGEQKIKR